MNKRIVILTSAIVVIAAISGIVFAFRVQVRDVVEAAAKPKLPPAAPYVPPKLALQEEKPAAAAIPKPPTAEPVTAPVTKPVVAAREVNLAVPFTSQAPHANWELPYQEACEEASLIMAAAYFAGESSLSAEVADGRILNLVEWLKTRFGYYEDTTAAETAIAAREYYGLNAEVIPVTSIEDVKKPLFEGKVVVIPAAGRLLKNPYFRGQGPLYHMLVVKGVTKDGKIITNDPGTRRGADFLYDPATLWNAIHDWNGGDVENGAKVMLVLSK